ncbi:hypothetical protein LguiA_010333 [Lonicera macranthoides]
MCNSHQIPCTQPELRPRMLKELLADDSYSYSYSIYSNKISLSPKLLRSRSKAASSTISAIRKAFNAVKYLSLRSPSKFPQSKPNINNRQNNDVQQISIITVKVKDILRWRSFRDLLDDKPQPLDFSSSPHRCTTATTTTGTTSTGSNSSRSSWCDSDFTAEESDLYSAADSTDKKPSNLYIDFEEEERGKALVSAVEAITSQFETNSSVDQLLFDLFREELSKNGKQKENYESEIEIDNEVLRVAKNWLSGEDEGYLKWKMGGSKEGCMREMEWGKSEEETKNVAIEMENEVLSYLIDELLNDLVDRKLRS